MVEDAPILNRYRPLLTVGTGASGTVEICWDTRIQRRVAIKRLSLAEHDPAEPIPGLAEARTAAMLSHPSIASVIDFEVEGNEALLIMEALEGPTVSQLIDNDPDHMLSLDVAAAVLDAVGEALNFAHENQVLHLDIKPDNILVDMAGHVKVTDFGVSELADAQGFGSAGGGTLGYMPPEQILGEDLDQRCDEFALASVVYEMLTGAPPYEADSLDTSLDAMENTRPTAPSLLRADIDPELDGVLLSALDPQRAYRYETVLEFVDEALALLGDPKAGTAELKQLARVEEDAPAQEGEQLRARRRGLARLSVSANVLQRIMCSLCGGVLVVLAGSQHGAFGPAETATAVVAALLLCTLLPKTGACIALAYCGASFTTAAVPILGGTLDSPAGQAGLVMGAAWLVSAVLMIWLSVRKTRVSSVIGVLGIATVLCIAVMGAHYITVNAPAAFNTPVLAGCAGASVCLAAIGALHAPRQRGEL